MLTSHDGGIRRLSLEERSVNAFLNSITESAKIKYQIIEERPQYRVRIFEEDRETGEHREVTAE